MCEWDGVYADIAALVTGALEGTVKHGVAVDLSDVIRGLQIVKRIERHTSHKINVVQFINTLFNRFDELDGC